MPNGQQPALHELTTSLCAPNVVLSSSCGRITCGDATGAYRHDRRSLAHAEFAVPTASLVPVGSTGGAGRARFQGVIREHADTAPDPTLVYVHDRVVTAESVSETWTARNLSADAVRLSVTLRAATDLARMDQVKAGEQPPLVSPSLTEEAAEKVQADALRRWVRTTGPAGRPLDHLLAQDYGAFEDALATLETQGFVVRATRRPG